MEPAFPNAFLRHQNGGSALSTASFMLVVVPDASLLLAVYAAQPMAEALWGARPGV